MTKRKKMHIETGLSRAGFAHPCGHRAPSNRVTTDPDKVDCYGCLAWVVRVGKR
jgi:hypothetical protein